MAPPALSSRGSRAGDKAQKGSHKPLQGPNVLVKEVTPMLSTGLKLGRIGEKKRKNLRFLRGPCVGQPQIPKVRFPILELPGAGLSPSQETKECWPEQEVPVPNSSSDLLAQVPSLQI